MTDTRTMALLGDVWYQVMEVRDGTGVEYKLYSKDYWVPRSWIKEFKEE
ncbi:hypothetical protein [Brevibacillus porteri]